MAINPNIKKKADDIRNKIYGKEVRESLASGLEAISSDVIENEGRQSVVESRQDNVESQWQDVSDEMTDKDVISAPEIILARDGESNLKARLDKDKSEVTAQFEQIDPHITPTVDASKFGLIPDTTANNAAKENARILNEVLNNYDSVRLDGTYWVEDVTINNRGLHLEGVFTLKNFGCENHVLKIIGPIEHKGSMIIHGAHNRQDGLVLEAVQGSSFDKVEARLNKGRGIVVLAKGNSNSVTAHVVRTSANGEKLTTNVKVVDKNELSGWGQLTTIELETPITDYAFREGNVHGVIVDDDFYEVHEIEKVDGKQRLIVRPHLPNEINEIIPNCEVLLGAGFYFEHYNDANWWNFNSYIATDYSVGFFSQTQYGHNFSNVLLEGVPVGMIIGTKNADYNTLINHPYVEGDVRFPIVTYRGIFTVIEPLYMTMKIYKLFEGALDLSQVTIISNGNIITNETDARHSSSGDRELYMGETLVLEQSSQKPSQTIILRERIVAGISDNKPATMLYVNQHDPQGTWNNDVTFKGEEGYTVNYEESYTFNSIQEEKYVFYAFITDYTRKNWSVIRVKGD